jgi:REP element-mobilizing transposase RayT
MSWTRIFIHLIFSTKDRVRYLDTKELRRKTSLHIKKNAMIKNIRLDCVNGYSDHTHCLLALEKDQRISEVAHLIKGESSFWINKNNLTPRKFAWQNDYWAISVGEKQIESLRNYIHHQEEHHRAKSFDEEIQEILERYRGFGG